MSKTFEVDGITPGEWFASLTSRPRGTIYIDAQLRDGVIQEIAACGPTETQGQQEKNATLFVEAGTVANETGLTPRQLANELAAAKESNAELLKKIAKLSPPSPKTGYGNYLEYVYSAGCSSAHAQSTAITCHLQYSEGYPADDVNPAESAHMDLCHAYIGGVDILNTLLSEEKIQIIEQGALEDYMRGEL